MATVMTKDVRARTRWLRALAGQAHGAGGLLLLDSGAAIGFAGGLAGGVTAVPHGVTAVLPWAALAVGAGMTRGLCAMAALRVGAAGAERVKQGERARMVEAALRRAPGRMLDAGTFATQAVDAVEALGGWIMRFTPARQAATVAPVLVLAATACASWFSALILAATLLPFIFAMMLAGGAAADESRRQFSALSRLSARFADRIRTLPVILAFQAEQRETTAISVAARDLAARTMRVLRVAFLSSAVLEFFAALSVALVAVYCGFSLLGLLPFPLPETLTLGEAFFALALAPEFYGPMRRLAAAYHDRQAAETAADMLMAVPGPVHAMPTMPPRPPLVLRDVTIRYPDSDRPAVDALSFVAGPGDMIALLGPSGSGKSSILHLLLGLAPLTGGSVTADGQPLATLAGHAGWVGQHPLLVAGTIRQNLMLANPTVSDSAVGRAIADAGLEPMLARRPAGFDTLLDARGGGLSGGERRRLALARALLCPAPFLLLDEPTAHLDSRAEAALIATISRAARGRTTLVATHSPALAAIATRVIRLGDGE